MDLPEQPSRSFPYEIKDQIGEGAMGAVYLARETSLDRKVAIKTLRAEFLDDLDEEAAREATRRFLQEARAIAQVSHRHIVSVYRLGTEDGSAFIAMEWLEGDTLEEVIEHQAPLPLEHAARWTIELLEALGAAHRHDIVHRDVKPANVIVDPEGHVKLTDFGVAQVRNSRLVQTQAGSMIGTPLYGAPEQMSDSRVDRRADLYSVGVILYEMLAGEVPFYETNVVRLIQKIMKEEPPPLSSHNPSLPEGVVETVDAALTKTPSGRFSSATAMAEALLEALPTAATSSVGHSSINIAATRPGSSTDIETAGAVSVPGTTASQLVINTVTDWESKPVGPTSTDGLLERLLETPVHARPFAGAVRVGGHLFLIAEGLVYGTVDTKTGNSGDAVYETKPEKGRATLLELPERLDHRVIAALGSLLHPPKREHEGLETGFTDMVNLYDRLCRERFDGAIRLEDDETGGLAFLLLDRGEPLVDIFSNHWERDPLKQGWQSWIGGRNLTAHVERRRTLLGKATYRRELSDLQVTVRHEDDEEPSDVKSTATSGEFRLSPMNLQERQSRASTTWREIYENDAAFQLLQWLRGDLKAYLRERGRLEGWKYLAGWVEMVETARLYHELERPSQGETDFFDLVTFDDTEKVLHLGRRVARGTIEQLNAFIDDVEAAKKARIKTGDVGGAVLVADEFDERMIEAYLERVERKESSWFFSFQESMTGYEGFVRMGARRGFHLLLVRRDEGRFKPVLPPNEG